MKIKIDWKSIDWKTMLKNVWKAIRSSLSVLLVIAGFCLMMLCGCTNMRSTPRGQTTEIIAFGVPAVAWISNTTQTEDHVGQEVYENSVTNSTTVSTPTTF